MEEKQKTEEIENNTTLREEDLIYFCGTETWYRHSVFRSYFYTDGIQYLAEHGGAYWLLDKIFACHSTIKKLALHEFCVWDLILDNEGSGAVLSCSDGNDNVLYTETITYTDFPLRTIRLFCQNNVLLLPSEY